jgi:hypothetical protein
MVGDTVNIQMAVNRPAEGTLSITPPSGPPAVFSYVFVGPTYTLAKTFTSQQVGRYVVNFQADDFCNGSSSALAYFDISPNTYDVSISLSSVPPQISAGLQVDGQSSGTIGGAQIKTLTFNINTSHTISVDQNVAGTTGIRYFAAQNTWTVSSGGSHTFSYQPQYLLTVATTPNGITQLTGGGWYNAGSIIQTGTANATLAGSAGTQYAFQNWQVDGVTQTGNPISITLDKPHTAVAMYQVQYYLTIDSSYGNPQGAGWYNSGSTATFSVTSPNGMLIQQVFVQWTGDNPGTATQATIAMDAPKTITAVWTTSYTQLYIALGAVAAVAAPILILKKRRSRGETTTKPTPSESPPPAAGATPPPPPPQPPTESTGPPTCPTCGADIGPGQDFCVNCGAKITSSPPPTASEVHIPGSENITQPDPAGNN